jgi:copper chaperone CopZ
VVSASRSHTFDLTALLPGDYYCGGCAERVCASVVGIEGVASASCDLEEGVLVVEYLPRTIGLAELEARVRRLALEETDSIGHAAYRLTGLD